MYSFNDESSPLVPRRRLLPRRPHRGEIRFQDTSPLLPRELDLEWDDGSCGDDDNLEPRCLEMESLDELPHKSLSSAQHDGQLPCQNEDCKVPIWLQIKCNVENDCDNDELCSLMTIESFSSSPSATIPRPLEFILDPHGLALAAKSAIKGTGLGGKKPPSPCSSRITSVMNLDSLPYHSGSCPCIEMSHLSTPDYQYDIRTLYSILCHEGNESLGDQFLMSLMVETNRIEGQDPGGNPAYIVPGFKDDNECRKFSLCREQFKNLFGLTECTTRRLQTRWKRGYASVQEETIFGWSPNLLSYRLGASVYMVFSLDD